MAASMGIELLDEEQYRELQKLGNFDTKTSSWLKTPPDIRKLAALSLPISGTAPSSCITTEQNHTTLEEDSAADTGLMIHLTMTERKNIFAIMGSASRNSA